MKKLLLFLALLVCAPAYAQNAGMVTNHAFAIGKGPKISGYTSLLCGSAQLAVGQAAASPICVVMSGDATLSAAGVLTLANTAVTPGSYTSSSITVDAKGRVTAASSGGASGITQLTGDVTAGPGSGSQVATLATVNSNTGAIGSATQCVTVTNNAKGLTTAVTATTCTPAIGSVTGLGTGVATALAAALSANGGMTSTIAGGTATMGTSAIASGACASVVTVSAANVTATDVVLIGFNGDPTATTGFIPTANGMLTDLGYPTSGNINIKECNNTLASITPGAHTFNWKVVR